MKSIAYFLRIRKILLSLSLLFTLSCEVDIGYFAANESNLIGEAGYFLIFSDPYLYYSRGVTTENPYIAAHGKQMAIFRYNIDTDIEEQVTEALGDPTGSNYSLDFNSAVMVDGSLYVSSSFNYIFKIDDIDNAVGLPLSAGFGLDVYIGDGTAATTDDATGTSAQINGSRWLASDGTYLYFTEEDSNNASTYLLRRATIDLVDGNRNVTTLFTTGSVLLGNMVYSGGNIYASRGSYGDGGYCIYKLDLTLLTSTVFAGECGTSTLTDGFGTSARFKGIFGMTLGESDDYIFINDSAVIRKLQISTGAVESITSSSFDFNQNTFSPSSLGSASETFIHSQYSLAYDSVHSALYLITKNNGSIIKAE